MEVEGIRLEELCLEEGWGVFGEAGDVIVVDGGGREEFYLIQEVISFPKPSMLSDGPSNFAVKAKSIQNRPYNNLYDDVILDGLFIEIDSLFIKI